MEHVVTFDAPRERKNPVRHGDVGAMAKEIADRLKPTKVRLNIMFMLATGWWPWGVPWAEEDGFANLPLCKSDSGRGGEYIGCCGHVLRRKAAQEMVSASLLDAGPPDRFGHPTLVITEAGKCWLGRHSGRRFG